MSFFVIWGTTFFHQFCVNQINLPLHPGAVDAACCSKMQAQEGVLAQWLFNFYYFPFRCRRGSKGLPFCVWIVLWPIEHVFAWMSSHCRAEMFVCELWHEKGKPNGWAWVFCCSSYLLPELSTCGFDVGLQHLIAQSLLTWGSSNYYSHSVALSDYLFAYKFIYILDLMVAVRLFFYKASVLAS